METVNCHTHTFYSGHGDGTVEQLLAAAEEVGMDLIAVTEHYPLSSQMDPTGELALTWEQLPQYMADVAFSRERHLENMEVVLGAEFDWLGSAEDRLITAESFEPFAYSLLSVHFLDGWGFDDPAQRHRWDEMGTDDVWRRYIEVWIEAADSWWPCTTMSHPDLAKKWGLYPSFDLTPYYKRMAEAAAARGRMVELNTSGAYYDCKQMYPAPALLAEFCKAGVPCSIGTDAHTPAKVGRGLKEGYKALYEAGYRAITVPTVDGDRRHIPFD